MTNIAAANNARFARRAIRSTMEPRHYVASGYVTAVATDSDNRPTTATVRISNASGYANVVVPVSGYNVYTGQTLSLRNDGTPSSASWSIVSVPSVPAGSGGGTIQNPDGNNVFDFDSIWVKGDGTITVGGEDDGSGGVSGQHGLIDKDDLIGYGNDGGINLRIHWGDPIDGWDTGELLLGRDEANWGSISLNPSTRRVEIRDEGETIVSFGGGTSSIEGWLWAGVKSGAQVGIGITALDQGGSEEATIAARNSYGVPQFVVQTGTENVYLNLGNPPPASNRVEFKDGVLSVYGKLYAEEVEFLGQSTMTPTGFLHFEDPDTGGYFYADARYMAGYAPDSNGQMRRRFLQVWGATSLETNPGSGVWETYIGGRNILGDRTANHFTYIPGASGGVGLKYNNTEKVWMTAAGDLTVSGTAYIESGTIGGWGIAPTEIYSYSDNNGIVLDTNAGADGYPVIRTQASGTANAIMGNYAAGRHGLWAIDANIGGWEATSTVFRSASSGGRVELDSDLNRVAIFDATNEKVVMGYLQGLPRNDGGGNWGSGDYGFWARSGDSLRIDGDGEYVNGDWIISHDAAYLITSASSDVLARFGNHTANSPTGIGVHIYQPGGSTTRMAYLMPEEIFVGNLAADQYMKYTVAGGLVVRGDITTDSVNVGTTGYVRGGLTGYKTPAGTSGFWIGYDSGAYKLFVGNTTGKYIDWTGTDLVVNGTTLSGDGDGITNLDGGNLQANTVTAVKLDVTAGGSNMLLNSTFNIDSNSDGVPDDWLAYNNSPGTEPHTSTRPTSGGVDDGSFYRISWNVANTTSKGIHTLDGPQGVFIPYETYIVSWWAKASLTGTAPAMGVYWSTYPDTTVYLSNPVLTTSWQKYVARITWGATVDVYGPYLSIAYASAVYGSLDIDHVQVEHSDTPSAWKPYPAEIMPGTITATEIQAGTITATEIQAGTITATQIAANTITASNISTLNMTGKSATFDTGTVGGWTLASNKLYGGSGSDYTGMIVGTGATKSFFAGATDTTGTNATAFITASGNATFENVTARGMIETAVFKYNQISATGGSIIISQSADKLAADMTSSDSSTLTIEGNVTFAVDDVLRMKEGGNDEWLRVTAIGSAPTYSVTRDLAGSYGAGANPAWGAGVAVVNYGQSGDGYIMQTADATYAPYISISTHSGSPWSSTSERIRLGNLEGVTGVTGFGLKADLLPLLVDSLVAHWQLNEESGTRYDSVGSLNLTDNGTVTYDLGKFDYAARFSDANNEFLSVTDSVLLSFSNASYTIAAWVKLDSGMTGSLRGIAGKSSGLLASEVEYIVDYTGTYFRSFVSNGSTTNNVMYTAITPVADTWYFVVGGFDASQGKPFISVNGGTIVYGSTGVNVWDSSNDFKIGRAYAGSDWDGVIDSVSVFNSALSQDEITSLYNGGDGLDLPFGSGAGGIFAGIGTWGSDFTGTVMDGSGMRLFKNQARTGEVHPQRVRYWLGDESYVEMRNNFSSTRGALFIRNTEYRPGTQIQNLKSELNPESGLLSSGDTLRSGYFTAFHNDNLNGTIIGLSAAASSTATSGTQTFYGLQGSAIVGTTVTATMYGVHGSVSAASGHTAYGVYGEASGGTSYGVYGKITGSGYGVYSEGAMYVSGAGLTVNHSSAATVVATFDGDASQSANLVEFKKNGSTVSYIDSSGYPGGNLAPSSGDYIVWSILPEPANSTDGTSAQISKSLLRYGNVGNGTRMILYPVPVPYQTNGSTHTVTKAEIYYRTIENDDYITQVEIVQLDLDDTVTVLKDYTTDLGNGSTGNGNADILSSLGSFSMPNAPVWARVTYVADNSNDHVIIHGIRFTYT